MIRQRALPNRRTSERGASLLMVAASLFIVLGIAALAIDLASLYVARTEAQRAADAAALAAANAFADSGCVASGTCATAEAGATLQAIAVGGLNFIGGTSVSILSGDVTYTILPSQNPRVTVTVVRTAARGNPVPTFFAKALGFSSADITVDATAEAYNPSGISGGPVFCTECVRPVAVGNCDTIHTTPKNSLCPSTSGYFLNPANNYAISNPGAKPAGVIGQALTVTTSTVPRDFPSIDYGGADPGYVAAVKVCPNNSFTCGNTVNTLAGARAASTAPAFEALIHASAKGLAKGQDTIDTAVFPPVIHAGTANPLVLAGVIASGAAISTSDSVVTFFVISGSRLPASAQSITILGFIQLFITQVDTNSNLPSVILNLAGCGTNAQANGKCNTTAGTVSGGGASLIPVRLIRTP